MAIINGTNNDDNLIGTTVGDKLLGLLGNDTLDGGRGSDTLIGGAGDDTYYADNINDKVIENDSEGTDIVYSSVSYALSNNVENLVLNGTVAINAVGNTLDNELTGNLRNNIIDGKAGSDKMTGGLGNDTYYVDNAGDNVVEALNEGLDVVSSSVTYSLSDNVENLTLSGTAAIDGTGNELSNKIIGNVADNSIDGGAGNDTLDGGVGADTLIGGLGDDTYYVDNSADVITENSGEGTDSVFSSASYVLSADVENLTLSGLTAINGTGNASDNTMLGNVGINILDGAAGNDVLNGGAGADTLIGGMGDDTYYVDNIGDVITENSGEGTDSVFSSVSYTLSSDVENLTLNSVRTAVNATGNDSDNNLNGNTNNNILDGKGGADNMVGGLGNDTYCVDNAGDVVTEILNQGTDTVQSSITYSLGANLEKLYLTGTDNIDGTGNSLNNLIVGNAGNNTLNGGIGNDTLSGGLGDDTYYIDGTSDAVVEALNQGTDTVISSISVTLGANLENLTLTGTSNLNGTGNALSNAITGTSGNNILNGGTGADSLAGGLGNDIYYVDNTGDVITENADEGIDLVSSSATYTLSDNIEKLNLTGTAAISGTGNASDNIITGNSGINTLDGAAGNDTLIGGLGADKLIGGLGDDIYYVDNTNDVIVENSGEGTDSVNSSATYTLSSDVENLTLTGSAAISGYGNASANTIIGNTGNNILDGKAGADTMIGGAGSDTYFVDDAGDVVTEGVGQGIDLVQSTVTYSIGANIEKLTLTGTGNIDGTGNSLNNLITGNSGNNVLDGATGNDTLVGGLGNDTYYIDGPTDIVIEALNQGTDTIITSNSYTLGANVENLTLTGTGNLNGNGNTLNNVILGTSGNNILDGGAGADSLTGGLGDDTYYVDNSGDVITENSGEGTDLVYASASCTLSADVENLTLTGNGAINGTGNASDNTIIGNAGINILNGAAGNDLINGGGGADTMIGGLGDDAYFVDNTSDVITENSGEGTDSVSSSATYTLSSDVENLTLTGISAINGTGNASDNTITGNTSNNVIDGKAGVDTMIGGLGNDSYFVDNVGDVVTEFLNQGTDIVQSTVTYTIGVNIEKLTLIGTDNIDGTGNNLNNLITGNAGNNVLDGGTGNDTLAGGLGNDTYYIDGTSDVVIEALNQGTDTVISSISGTLGANIENLTLTGTGNLNGTGNTLDNVILGTSGNNILDGGAGADSLTGGLGDDTYYIDNTGDVITENSGEGTDLVCSSVSNTLGADLENLTLIGTGAINGTGNAFDNTITGNSAVNILDGAAGNDVLNGGLGADTLIGGLGDDAYYVDNSSDVITENAGEGTDSVYTSASYTISDNVETLTLIGNSSINGTGNDAVNTITGNAGNNTLDGKGGADTMIGGLGNDTYFVDDAADVVTEDLNQGTDTVKSLLTYTLGSNVERLTLLGTTDLNGTGNELNNSIIGNAGNNILDGKAGADTMSGGLGNDTYYVDNSADVILENSNEGNDIVYASDSYTLSSSLEDLTLTGTDDIDGTGNSSDNEITGNAGNNYLSGKAGDDTFYGGGGTDTFAGGLGNDTYYIDNSDNAIIEVSGEGTDTVLSSTSYVLNENIENLVLVGTDDIDGTGNGDDNTITGNDGMNVLSGGLGNDTYYINNVGDSVFENMDAGIDTVFSSVSTTLNDDVENLTLSGSDDLNGTGNYLDNTITGNAGNNTLDGGFGVDTMIGGYGDDTYYADNALDTIVEDNNEGADLVYASDSFTLGSNVEDLTLIGVDNINATGNDLNNILTGNTGDNILNGSLGVDTMSGGFGNDTYYIDSLSDVISENADEGNDTVCTSFSYTLDDNFENITLTGTDDVNATGNALDNVLNGNEGDNILNGVTGLDTLIGGLGNDTYLVGDAGASIVENEDEGTDRVYSSVTYALSDNVENLFMTGTDNINGTGNNLGNLIVGNDGDNVIDGGLGADTMTGGLGNDTYYYDNASDLISENENEGTDLVYSSLSYTLDDNIENVALIGTANVNVTGNKLDNVITGNEGNNTIIGGTGSDTLVGGDGNDTYLFNKGDGKDVIDETTSAASDVVKFTDSAVTANDVAIYVNEQGDLIIDYGTNQDQDQIFVQSQMTNANASSSIEKIELSGGLYIDDSDINKIVQDMTAYAAENSIQISNVGDVKSNSDLMAIVANAWHS